MYRLFVALDIPFEIRKRISMICCGLNGVKWVPEENLHLTLKFIGEKSEDVAEEIAQVLSEIKFEAFEIILKDVGCFPIRKDPKILWIGVNDNLAINSLFKKIEKALISLELEPEKRNFYPHVTIARIEKIKQDRLSAFYEKFGLFKTEAFHIKEFHLYSSHLTNKGSIYEKLASFPCL